MHDLVDAGTPVLGICLGSQLLAGALGGGAQVGEAGLEWGLVEVRSEQGATHPLGPALAGTAFAFHSDTFVLPPGATVLARSERYVQAWSLGSALAIQFHPEISPSGVQSLVDHEADKLAAARVDGPGMVRDAWSREQESRAAADRVIGGWLDLSRIPGSQSPAPRPSTTSV
jgi:GMP synthase (glutamine-hydrolysing)